MTGKGKLLLWLILGVSLFLRVIYLNRVPIGLFGDEVDVGYQSYSLWITGRDYMSQKFPFYIHSINEWRAPLLMYVTAPFVGILGLNEWGVRLPPALLGVLSIYLVYLLAGEISKNNKVALWSALICAIIPWHLHYSRVAFESTLLMCLVLSGIIFYLKKRLILSAVAFGMSFYAYNTANIFVPLMILFLIFTSRNIFKSKLTFRFFLPVLVFAVLCLPIAWNIFFKEGATRFKSVSLSNDNKIIDEIVFKRNSGVKNEFVERVFHNKLWSIGTNFFKNYLSSFSPQFLFLNGDANPRHNVPGFGELFLPMFLFLSIGLFFLLNNPVGQKTKQLILFWLLTAPIPSALTKDGSGHATRLFLLIFPLVFLIGLGIEKITDVFWKKAGVVFLLVFCVVFWWHEYLVHYPKEQAEYWHYGYKEAFLWLEKHETQFSRIILNNRHDPLLISYCFWTQKSPLWFRENYKGDGSEKNIIEGFDGFRTGSVYLGGISESSKQSWLVDNLDGRTLYFGFQEDEIPGDWDWSVSAPKGIKVLEQIKDPFSGKPFINLLTGADQINQ